MEKQLIIPDEIIEMTGLVSDAMDNLAKVSRTFSEDDIEHQAAKQAFRYVRVLHFDLLILAERQGCEQNCYVPEEEDKYEL